MGRYFSTHDGFGSYVALYNTDGDGQSVTTTLTCYDGASGAELASVDYTIGGGSPVLINLADVAGAGQYGSFALAHSGLSSEAHVVGASWVVSDLDNFFVRVRYTF